MSDGCLFFLFFLLFFLFSFFCLSRNPFGKKRWVSVCFHQYVSIFDLSGSLYKRVNSFHRPNK